MFCQKCGSQVNEGARFCQKCGTEVVSVNPDEQQMNKTRPDANKTRPDAQSLVRGQPQPSVESVSTVETKNKKSSGKSTQKKSKKKILAAALAIVIFLIVIVAFPKGGIDYEATVEAHKPFAVSQGLPYTYGEVLGRYISSPQWKTRVSGNEAYVDIGGTLKGTDMEMVVTIKVMLDPEDLENVLIRPSDIILDGIKSPTQEDAVQLLYVMFAAYDEGYEDLAELLSEEAGGSLPDGGGIGADNAGKKIYYVGDTVQMTWEDGSSVEIAFLDWGTYYDYKNDRCLYIECEITNTGTDELRVERWFNVYADNYVVDSSLEGEWASLSPNRSAHGKIRGEIDPDSVSVIEVEFADAILVVKDESQASGIWSDEDSVLNEDLAGYYVGDMFYEMSINIYSSPENQMIGNVAIYQDGDMVDMGELFQADENAYGIMFDGVSEERIWHIYPCYDNGKIYIELIDENGYYVDILYMQEHYVS